MEDNKELVEETTENVEGQTTEEIVEGNNTTEEYEDVELTDSKPEEKLYSEKELNERVDELLAKKIAKKEAKIRREYEKKYGRAENVIKAGLETDNFEEAIDDLENFYREKGVEIPKYTSEFEINAIANAMADEVIEDGYDSIVSRTNYLAEKIESGKATPSEKIEFNKVANERKRLEGIRDLESIGITEKDLTDDFKAFSNKLNPNMSLKEKYEMFLKYNPKPRIEPIGSMSNNDAGKKAKDHYTMEEISRLTSEDLDNPAIWEAVQKSLTNQ